MSNRTAVQAARQSPSAREVREGVERALSTLRISTRVNQPTPNFLDKPHPGFPLANRYQTNYYASLLGLYE